MRALAVRLGVSRDDRHVKELLTLDRLLGHVWIAGDTKSVSQRMVESGHAVPEKPKPSKKPPIPPAKKAAARIKMQAA